MIEQSKFQNLPLGAIKPLRWMLAQLRSDLANGFARSYPDVDLLARMNAPRRIFP